MLSHSSMAAATTTTSSLVLRKLESVGTTSHQRRGGRGGEWPSPPLLRRIRSSADRGSRPPADEFAPLAATFRRRLLVGVGLSSSVAVGANFAGLTSFLLGFVPELGRRLKLDAVYPIQGYTRCLDATNGFEFIYPANWVGDQTLLYRAVGREESRRQLDPPPLNANLKPQPRNLNEPIAAFGPPGSNGELNVSVIVSSVPFDFSIEAFGGPKEVGTAVMKTITRSSGGGSVVKATLIDSSLRQDPSQELNYYQLEFTVESPTFRRHNIAVCSACRGRLFTLNAQAPESAWSRFKDDFDKIANSFAVIF